MNASPEPEQGSATLFVVAWIVVLVAVAGLVYDGGHRLAAEQAALDTAQEAARAGAQALTGATRTGIPELNPAVARHAADNHLAVAGYEGDIHVNGDRITVTATRTNPTGFLGVFGIDTYTVTVTASAQALSTPGPGRP